MKIVKTIQLKIVLFTAVKSRCILHGRVFVMTHGKPLNVEQQLKKVSVLKERWRHLRMVNVSMTCPLAVIKSITGDAMYFYLRGYFLCISFLLMYFFSSTLIVCASMSAIFGPMHHTEAVLGKCLVLAAPEILSN